MILKGDHLVELINVYNVVVQFGSERIMTI